MKSFLIFITESMELTKLTHLEHPEDHVIHAGNEGAKHAIDTLDQVHKSISAEKSSAKVHVKYDGSPSIVFGRHPETGKFFVGTKAALSKNPKLNYTDKDIETNHGHSAGLVGTLKHALKHLPKIAPDKGIYQGDFMHEKSAIKSDKTHHHFTPNTLTYSVKKDSEEGKKISKSKIGMAIHTKYHGNDLSTMKAGFDVDHKNFKEHPDVHVIKTEHETSKVIHTPEAKKEFETHIKKAKDILAKHTDEHLAGHNAPLKKYINSTVRSGEKPDVKKYQAHVKKEFKTNTKHDSVKNNKDAFEKTFALHHHIQQAKNALVKSLSSHGDYSHSVNGTPTKPEGFVAHVNNKPTKLVDRNEFSRLNLTREH